MILFHPMITFSFDWKNAQSPGSLHSGCAFGFSLNLLALAPQTTFSEYFFASESCLRLLGGIRIFLESHVRQTGHHGSRTLPRITIRPNRTDMGFYDEKLNQSLSMG
jgi:hypothetical protein